ncbi:hypothetical protein [Mesonia aquimarina]|uniref:hypothetical protein n=1 Tax=Mesonia aquimarina TaxID=1504967 RepID=UPI000EF61D58|nr:hypothetical protein [Mesonia aquimarina]
MKNRNVKYLSIVIIVLLILAIPFVNFKVLKIRGYINDFEKVNNFILKNKMKKDMVSFAELMKKTNEFPILQKAVNKSELCGISYYQDKGIVYKFQCINNSYDNFLDSDDKYFLIKILNKSNELLTYEKFIDYSQKPIKLKNDWYLIEQNITYD